MESRRRTEELGNLVSGWHVIERVEEIGSRAVTIEGHAEVVDTKLWHGYPFRSARFDWHSDKPCS